MANRNQSAEQQNAIARLSQTEVVNVRKAVSQAMDAHINEAKSLSNRFKWLRQHFPNEVTDFLVSEKLKGKKVNDELVQRIICQPDFALFKKFLSDKQAEKEYFTSNEMLGILLKAVTTKEEVIAEMDANVPAESVEA